MKKLLLIISIVLYYNINDAQTFNYQWAKGAGSTLADQGNSITVDKFGNSYVTGYFNGTADFDPGVGVVNLTSAGGMDIFYAKYNASGGLVWAKSIGGASPEQGNSIAVDDSGYVYITGNFRGTAEDFDPGPGVANLASYSLANFDIFFAKYDSLGNYVWAKKVGYTTDDYGNDIAVDESGNVYVGGYFQGTPDFDPAAGTAILTSHGQNDVFFAKYDRLGNYLWAKDVGGTSVDNCYKLKIDKADNVYIYGDFYGPSDFDPSGSVYNLTSASQSVFFAKYDLNGNFIWAKSLIGTMDEYSEDITVDTLQNVYVQGLLQGTMDFDPGPGTHNLTCISGGGSRDLFFAKYDSLGNLTWAENIGGSSSSQMYGYGIKVDNLSNVILAGIYTTGADFDPGPGVVNIPPGSLGYAPFLAEYDATGNYISAKNFSGAITGNGMVNDPNNNVYLTGYYSGTVNFDPSGSIPNMTPVGNNDIFIAKYKFCSLLSSPGTILGTTPICSGTTNTYHIPPVAGAISYTWTLPGGWTGTSTTDSIIAVASGTGGNITVTANNVCGSSTIQSLAITVSHTPATPSTITGTTTICSGTSHTYFISPVAGATSYTWTLPGGWTGTSTTTSITTTASTTSGNITVTANNACGISAVRTLAVTVNPVPVTPGAIAGTTTICSGSSNTYSIVAVAGATSYTWTLPGGWTGTSTTTSITTTASTTSGNITVTANNACGISAVQTLAVTVNPVPVTPGAIAGTTTICSGSSNTYSIVAVAGATSYTWTLPGGWTGTSTTTSITTTASTTSGNITVTANNACGISAVRTLAVTVNPLPLVTYSQSPSMVCSGVTSVLLATATPSGGVFSGTSVIGSNFDASTAGTGTFAIIYSFTDLNSCTDSATSYITVSACTDVQKNGIGMENLIYPNPTSSVFTVITSLEQHPLIIVYNALGKKIYTTTPNSDKTEIDLSEETNGIYFVNIITAQGVVSKKIIKQ